MRLLDLAFVGRQIFCDARSLSGVKRGVVTWRCSQNVSLSGIARALEARGVQTPRGLASWHAAQVSQVKAMAA